MRVELSPKAAMEAADELEAGARRLRAFGDVNEEKATRLERAAAVLTAAAIREENDEATRMVRAAIGPLVVYLARNRPKSCRLGAPYERDGLWTVTVRLERHIFAPSFESEMAARTFRSLARTALSEFGLMTEAGA